MTPMSLADRFFVDSMSETFREDPYPHYEMYRNHRPLVRAADTMWLCFGHADVTSLLRDPKLSSDERRATTEIGSPEPGRLETSLLFMEPPDHTRLRSLVARAFTPKRVADLRPTAEAITANLLDDLRATVASGDVVDLRQFPVIDAAKGGSIHGELEALNRLLTELVVPNVPLVLKRGGTLVVPGHGYVSDYAEVVEYRDMVTVVKDTIQELIGRGLTLEQVKAANPAGGYRGRYGSDSGQWTTDMFVEAVFNGLSRR